MNEDRSFSSNLQDRECIIGTGGAASRGELPGERNVSR